MPRPSNTAERRIQIARALLHVMAKTGYAGASVADVAKVAKIAPGLVHYHFKNKLEILLVAIDELAQGYDARLDLRLAAASGRPDDELRAFIDAHLRLGSDADPEALACWIDISGEALREPRVRKALAKIMVGSVRRLSEILKRGQSIGVFACDEPEAAAAAIVATIQGYYVIGATARDVIPRGSAAGTLHVMCEGLVGIVAPVTRTGRRRP